MEWEAEILEVLLNAGSITICWKWTVLIVQLEDNEELGYSLLEWENYND